jgi:CDP-diacylglycerol---glycerol-3-phosphate 3-phosphatidyltransferase
VISVYKIKPKFQQLLKPLLAWLYKTGVTANQITVMAILLSLVLGACLWFSPSLPIAFLIVPFGLLLRMALNALDGMMARTYHMQSKLGEILNEIGDVVSDVFIFLPLVRIEGLHVALVIAFVALSVINEFAGFMGKVIANERRYDGPMGKSDRALVIGVLCIVLFFYPLSGVALNSIFGICIALMGLSTVIRLKKALRNG